MLYKYSGGLANWFHSLQNKSQKSGFLDRDLVKNFLYNASKFLKLLVHIAQSKLKMFPRDEKDCKKKNSRVRSQKLVDYLNSVHISVVLNQHILGKYLWCIDAICEKNA